MNTVLAVSPHLDDVAFSCGGTLAMLADAGWRTILVTAFTRSVMPAQGFALACQLDKGLSPDVDYMALRRAEDRVAASHLGAEPRWLDLPEAPHRGYHSAAALFAGIHADDAVWQDLAPLLSALVAELRPTLLLCPQGLGRHVDHLQTIRAVQSVANGTALAYYRDTPYAIREPNATPHPSLPESPECRVPIGPGLARKVSASTAYATQLGFQFGGAQGAAAALAAFAAQEGGERFIGPIPLAPPPCP